MMRQVCYYRRGGAKKNLKVGHCCLHPTHSFQVWFLKLMKILIVDDNQQVRTLLRDYLPAAASEVFECADGEHALAMYQKYRPDWVLMDQDMPATDGITAIRQIIAEFPKAKICMVTVLDDDDLRCEAFNAGASGFVLKDKLFELEAILVGGSSASGAVARP